MNHVLILSMEMLWALSLACGVSRGDDRVLIIGVDGAGGGYVQTANTPNFDALAASGAVRYDFLNEGALILNPPGPYGASGVNWSTILTGASAASHHVADNGFGGNNFAEVPSFFHYVKQHDPTLFTASIVNWSPINTYIVADEDADLELSFDDVGVKNGVVDLLSNDDPGAIFLHFDEVDAAGHAYSWGSPQYYAAIETVDGLVGEIMAALNSRPGVLNRTEDWLVMLTADHGGAEGAYGHDASQGPINWQVPVILSGPSVVDGVALPQGTLRDLATTALWHLGIDPFGTTVEGNVVGIPFGPPNGIVGDVNQDGLVTGDGTGPAATDDVTAFVQGWLTQGHTSVLDAYTHGDINLDRVTDLYDWSILNHLSPAMGQAVLSALNEVPEPTSMPLLLGVLLAMGIRDRR